MKKIILSMLAACAVLFATSCENGDVEFDNYDYQTISFANQAYVRNIQLGDDVYLTDDDNQHKFYIKATLGGDRNLKSEHKVKIVVDNSLCEGLKFADTNQAVTPMPDNYYQLQSDVITIPAGQVAGGVEVQLTDAFFADPKALDKNYVIPIRMVDAGNDSILSGTKKETVENPVLQNADDWNVAPKNYTLCCVTYKNAYHGAWISHGTDNIDLDGTTSVVTREAEYLENNDIRYMTTLGLGTAKYALSTVVDITNAKGEATTATLNANLILNVDDSGNVTVKAEDNELTDVPGSGNGGKYSYTATGSGKWEYKGAKKAWGDKDRDQMTLDYTLTYTYTDKGVNHVKKYTCKDILVFRDHQNAYTLFNVTYSK